MNHPTNSSVLMVRGGRRLLERGWRADWIDRKYIPPDWSKVYLLIGGPPVRSTEMQAYNDLLSTFTRRLEPRDEIELIWTKEATDATWEGRAREKNRLTSVAQLANALDHGRPLDAGLKYYRGLDVAPGRKGTRLAGGKDGGLSTCAL